MNFTFRARRLEYKAQIIQSYNIPVAQKPAEKELLLLGLLEKQHEYKLHVFLKKP